MSTMMQFLSAEGDLEDDYDAEVICSADSEDNDVLTGEKLMVLAFLRLAIRDRDVDYFENDSYNGLSFRFICECFNVDLDSVREAIIKKIKESRHAEQYEEYCVERSCFPHEGDPSFNCKDQKA